VKEALEEEEEQSLEGRGRILEGKEVRPWA
jgi:hypothetical protein